MAIRYRSFNLGGRTTFSADEPLILLHIFKTAGSTVRLRIERSIDHRRIQGIYRTGDMRARVKGYVVEPDLVHCGAELYYGHMFHGVHNQLGVAANYGTFLRSPVERAVSHYRHFERFTDGRPRTLTQHLDEQNVQLDNLMTRVISGHRAVPFGELRQVHLDHALEHLSTFRFVGFVEHLEQSLTQLGALLGVTLAGGATVNVNPKPTSADDGSVAELTELNWADIALYNAAMERFGDH